MSAFDTTIPGSTGAMSSGFLACLDITLVYEGGKADDPRDPGGRTNKGITQQTYNGYRRGRGLATRDVYEITDAEVADIYYRSYWLASTADKQPAGLNMMTFDGSVNSGVSRGKKWLAKALATKGTVEDQIHTAAAVRMSMLEALRTWRTFGKGWGRRVSDVEAKSIRMWLASLGHAPVVVSKIVNTKAQTFSDSASTAKTQGNVVITGAVATGAAMVALGVHPTVVAAVGVTGLFTAVWRWFVSHVTEHRAAAFSAAA